MTTSTLERPQTMLHFIDAVGTTKSLTHIEGQPLEEYFASDSELQSLADGNVAFMDGLMETDLRAPVAAGIDTIMIGEVVPSNG